MPRAQGPAATRRNGTYIDHFAQDRVDLSLQPVGLPHMLSSSLPAPPLASKITPLSLNDTCWLSALFGDVSQGIVIVLSSLAVQFA